MVQGINTILPVENIQEKCLLIVDDDPAVIRSLTRALRSEKMEILSAESAQDGMLLLENNNIGVILSDQMMPEMDGVQFLAAVRDYDPDIVRLLLTGHASISSAIQAIKQSQIFEYLTKPWDIEGLKNTLQRAFDHYKLVKENSRLHKLTHDQNKMLLHLNDTLEKRVEERTLQLNQAVREGVLMLSLAAESRDDVTGNHLHRLRDITHLLCQQMNLDPKMTGKISFFSMMHDVGKIHIPDNILKKSGKLNKEERKIMQSHTIVGEKILRDSPYYEIAREIARSHHEWYDGNGYPDGIKGKDIPLSARIVAVADVFDALTHSRSYKKAWRMKDALSEIKRLAGTQFDKNVTAALLKISEDQLSEFTEY